MPLPFFLLQVPGTVRYVDVTPTLQKQSYWPSYNCPYIKEVFDISGWPEYVQQYGDFYTYDKNPRYGTVRLDGVGRCRVPSCMSLLVAAVL